MPEGGAVCEYELQRRRNIAANEEQLAEMGLGLAVQALRNRQPAPRKRVRDERPHVPTRPRSARVMGVPAELEGLEDEYEVPSDENKPHGDALKRASSHPRLTAEQSARLDALEEVSTMPLTEDEMEAIKHAREYLTNESSNNFRENRWKGLWGEKRKLLHEARELFGLRWPTWLDKIQSALPPMGTTDSARDQTMFAIERAACGLGLTYKAWPDGVGVLLANDEPIQGVEAPRPRILTLGSDTEMLKREGQRLEHKFGRDAGNGWAYNHALGKLRLYQEKLLQEEFDPPQVPDGPSVRELEEQSA